MLVNGVLYIYINVNIFCYTHKKIYLLCQFIHWSHLFIHICEKVVLGNAIQL